MEHESIRTEGFSFIDVFVKASFMNSVKYYRFPSSTKLYSGLNFFFYYVNLVFLRIL